MINILLSLNENKLYIFNETNLHTTLITSMNNKSTSFHNFDRRKWISCSWFKIESGLYIPAVCDQCQAHCRTYYSYL